MGFFSRLWKGIKKVAKKVFKPIKSVFKAVGKFMGKIGIVGQIAMSFILPGIGGVLAQTFGKAVSALAGGALGTVGKAAGWVLGKAGTFAKTIGQGFKTVTSAVTDFIGTTGKYVGGKLGIPGMDKMTLGEAFGKEGWGGRLTDSISKLGKEASNFWQSDLESFADRGIMTPDQKLAFDQKEQLDKFGNDVSEDIKAQQSARGADADFKIDADGNRIKVNVTPDQVTGDAVSTGVDKVKNVFQSKIIDPVQDMVSDPFGYAGEKIVEGGKQMIGEKFSLKSLLSPSQEYDMGPSFGGGYVPQSRSQLSEAAQMGLQPVMQDSYADYVTSSNLNTNPQGIYGGANNYAAYFKRMAVFQGQGG